MASEVDICNQALANLGDSATVASINPPEGSAQAEHCQRFYPLARDTLLDMHNWGFATRRAALAQLTNESTEWAYAYAVPINTINVIAIHPAGATSDYSVGVPVSSQWQESGTSEIGIYTPQDFSVETNSSGAEVILTNVADAWARYVVQVTDTAKFSPLFTEALIWLLSSKLAGPVIKGAEGRGEARACMQIFKEFFGKAAESDANQQRHTVKQSVGWMVNR
jgi:hypothetical protein